MQVYRKQPNKPKLAIVAFVALAVVLLIVRYADENGNAMSVAADPMPNAQVKIAEPAAPKPSRVYKVMIDPGHGGEDPGATGASGELEKTSNLAIALQVAALLKQDSSFDVSLTRSDDTYVGLEERAEMANDWGADVLLSIHGNSFEEPDIAGTETFYRHEDSMQLASVIHSHLVAAMGNDDRGVKEERLEVLSYSEMPAILVEPGFLTNASDENEIIGAEGQARIAQSIADGLKQYFRSLSAPSPDTLS